MWLVIASPMSTSMHTHTHTHMERRARRKRCRRWCSELWCSHHCVCVQSGRGSRMWRSETVPAQSGTAVRRERSGFEDGDEVLGSGSGKEQTN